MSTPAHFRQDIQGLRALAILPVVAFHAFPKIVPGGYVGVDLFFVISGFLITSVLTRELNQGHLSITTFYVRRVKRLFPALYVMLAVTMAAGALLLPPIWFKQLAQTALATIFFVSNFAFIELTGYFDGTGDLKPLLHTWSLAVEEQFYLIFPLALLVLNKVNRRLMVPAFWLGLLASLALSAWAVRESPDRDFYLPITRAYELLIGALLATRSIPLPKQSWSRNALALIGLGLVVWSIWVFDSETPFPGTMALVPCLGAAAIIHAGMDESNLVGRLLSLPLLVFFGSISYSLYLWHWPMLVYSRYIVLGELAPWHIGVAVITAVVAATLSWRYVEQPVLANRNLNRGALGLGAGAMMVGALVSIGVFFGGGLPGRFSPPVQKIFASAKDKNDFKSGKSAPNDSWILGSGPTVVAIWGDSMGAEISIVISESLAGRSQAAQQFTSPLCPPTIGYTPPNRPVCDTHNQRVLRAIVDNPQTRTVVMAAAYTAYVDKDREAFQAAFARAARALHASGKAVVILYPVPELPFSSPDAVGMALHRGGNPASFGMSLAAYNRQSGDTIKFLDALSRDVGAIAIRPTPSLCPNDFCHGYLEQPGSLYFDRRHMTLHGARWVLQHQKPFY